MQKEHDTKWQHSNIKILPETSGSRPSATEQWFRHCPYELHPQGLYHIILNAKKEKQLRMIMCALSFKLSIATYQPHKISRQTCEYDGMSKQYQEVQYCWRVDIHLFEQ